MNSTKVICFLVATLLSFIVALLSHRGTIVKERISTKRHLRSSTNITEGVDDNVFRISTFPLLPPGPYITPSVANEKVIFPHPSEPSNIFNSSSCPHHQSGLMDWHSNATWGGSVPIEGNVTLPSNARVIVRRSLDNVLDTIRIPSSSELIFDENINGIEFDVKGMEVEGKLIIGSETCRMSTPVTITLHGNRPDDAATNVPDPRYKGISVTGEISMHGQRFYRTWARLAVTAEPSSSFIMLQHRVNWLPGQRIVLVSTAMKDSREWHRNEIAVIKSVELDPVPGIGAAVFLEVPLSFQHVANNGYQGEVGLLTRTVRIQGNSASEPSDPDPLNCEYGSTNRDIYGDKGRPCPNTELTGYGGHIMIHETGMGFVEGVELYRMGQTNVMGRYPMHFHLLGDCPKCYFRDSSIHRSFYRCISIHGTNYMNVTENVAYDVVGSCYYLEDGVEHHNRIEFNLGAHIHMLGPGPPWSTNQKIPTYESNINLTMPSDVAASAFYITNVQNYVIGNAASGGWAGFAFPNLPTPLGPYRDVKLRPSNVIGLTIDGNSAHSSGWWWDHSGPFYIGGSLYYNDAGILEYNAGRDIPTTRRPCLVNKCLQGDCGSFCRPWEMGWLKISNSKAFLAAGVGLSSWGARLELYGYECHDCGLSLEALSEAFYMEDMLAVCRTKSPIALPGNVQASNLRGDGFRWYDTGQKHIINGATFRNCGYRSNAYDQYDKSSDRGCGDDSDTGCTNSSSVWSFVTHSDNMNPEVMQATKSVSFENCGRRFYMYDFRGNQPSSNSGRQQNWLDVDGTASGLGKPAIIGSGLADAGMWWKVDNNAVYEPQAPLWFYKVTDGPQRGLGHFHMLWDSALAAEIGKTQCGNGKRIPCDYVGSIKHIGSLFQDDDGLPVTAAGDVTGPVGGFGWKLELDRGAPTSLVFSQIEVDPDIPMLISIAYPPGTSFNISHQAGYCSDHANYTCFAKFYEVDSVKMVRNSEGNTYHVDSDGVLTLRLVMTPKTFTGRPDYFLPQWSDVGRYGLGNALERFTRGGITLPQYVDGTLISLNANCPSNDGVYCSAEPGVYEPKVCPRGYRQSGYDTCSSKSKNGEMELIFSDGSNRSNVPLSIDSSRENITIVDESQTIVYERDTNINESDLRSGGVPSHDFFALIVVSIMTTLIFL